MKTSKRRTFSAEFKLEAASLVTEQGYSVKEASEVMNVGLSTMGKWVRQLKDEQKGLTPTSKPITAEQRRIRELEKRIKRIELEKEILKKATALLMSDALNDSD